MTKFESLIHLVHSMSRSEKKNFRIKSCKRKTLPDYVYLYDTIEAEPNQTPSALRTLFLQKRPGAAFESTVNYLFELILETAIDMREEQDKHYMLFNKIMKARVLYEKSLFDESFELLENVKLLSEKYENYHALLLAGRLELEYLLALNFPNLSEAELLKKQFKLNESLKFLRKVNEQSSLYEILKHRLLTKGYTRSLEQKNDLNDLVYSEISIVASLSPENFEISKLHQLFQSNYLISVGDYKSALRSFYELSKLFEDNKHLWNTPPVYYLYTIEGVLESLRSIRNYSGMTYFIDQLKKIDNTSVDFKINLTCIIFLYELFPHLDRGDFKTSEALMKDYKDNLYNKLFSLNRARQAELCLYTSLVYFGNAEYQKAHKFLSQIIIRGKNYFYLPLYRTIRMVNLMIIFKLKDFDLIKYEIRSIKRELSKSEKGYKIERFLLGFLQKEIPALQSKRNLLWEKHNPELTVIQNDVFEQPVLRIFDFTAWVESVLLQKSLSKILREKIDLQNFQIEDPQLKS